MEPIKIAVTDYIEPDLEWERQQLAKYEHVAFAYHQLKFAPREQLMAAIRDADAILVNMTAMNAEVIGQLERCRLIIRHGVGYDNVDVAAATARRIRVAYEPDYCTDEVAEHAIALMLAAWRKLFIGRQVLEDSSAKGIWSF
ncbi:MAG: C-terminal binding protein, partial [Candidatus Latescibacterota bacterium]